MANSELVDRLKRGREVWNEWRTNNPDIKPDLHEADLAGVDLHWANLAGADLSWADLSGADLHEANLVRADLQQANVVGADLSWADLRGADLREAHLRGTDLRGVYLRGADLRGADLAGANLRGADLYEVDLAGANLENTDLRGASLVQTNLTQANLSGARIFGISAWKVNVAGVVQTNLIISDDGDPVITVDNLEVAQFIYLLLHNEKLRDVIDIITTKSVLILGRFTPERKVVLDAIREELRQRNYVPILFDFEKPGNRDLTETVMTLAGMARFVIADLSDPNSIPHELMSFAEKFLSVPIQPIFCPVKEHPNEYPMIEHLRRLPHVLSTFRYETPEELIALLSEKVIEPAEAKVDEVRPKRL